MQLINCWRLQAPSRDKKKFRQSIHRGADLSVEERLTYAMINGITEIIVEVTEAARVELKSP